jgi:hypothetical protein
LGETETARERQSEWLRFGVWLRIKKVLKGCSSKKLCAVLQQILFSAQSEAATVSTEH